MNRQEIREYYQKRIEDRKPDYYKTMDPEPAEVVEKWDLGYWKGQAVAYIGRAGRKAGNDEFKELEKAIDCLERRIVELLSKGYDPSR